ncbi:MAG: hypothetical protein HN491_12280, partial [Rhodospirillales bacterium]|nr:hypothetical protein [Rhodospirillales bacterium]
ERIGKAWKSYLAMGNAPSAAWVARFHTFARDCKLAGYDFKRDKPPAAVIAVFDRMLGGTDASIRESKPTATRTTNKRRGVREYLPNQLSIYVKKTVVIAVFWVLGAGIWVWLFGDHFFDEYEEERMLQFVFFPPVAIVIAAMLWRWACRDTIEAVADFSRDEPRSINEGDNALVRLGKSAIKIFIIIFIAVLIASTFVAVLGTLLDGTHVFGVRMRGVAKENTMIYVFLVTFFLSIVFVRAIMRRKKKLENNKHGKHRLRLAIGAVLFVLLIGSWPGLFFLKSMVIEMVPATAPIYEIIGLEEVLGDGLDLGKPSVERGSEGGIDFITLKGSITNMTDSEKPVPFIKAFLADADGDEIQSVVQEPVAAMIEGGGVLAYSIKFEEPSPLARSLEVTFVARPAEGMQQ